MHSREREREREREGGHEASNIDLESSQFKRARNIIFQAMFLNFEEKFLC